LILDDGGGSNGGRARLGKQQLQEDIGDRLGLMATVGPDPRGCCSMWNPIEHRQFRLISLNWVGPPFADLGEQDPCICGAGVACIAPKTYVVGGIIACR